MLELLFLCLITLQFLVIVSHDFLNIPGWQHGRQVQAVVGRNKLLIATLIGAIFPAVAVACAFLFWHRPKPISVTNYWIIYCGVTLTSAIGMWYVPYFLGCTEQRKREYASMYAGTRQVLPPRGDNPAPNLLHICFHVLFVVTLCLAVMMRLRNG